MNEVIGTSGCATLSELVINDTTLAGYVAFEDDQPARVVLLDSVAFLSNGTETRPTREVQLDVGEAFESAEVKRLFMA